MKQVYVDQIRAGDKVDELFVLAEKALAHKRDGNPYLNLTLADRTGRIRAVAWDGVDQITAAAEAGDFVRVKAAAGQYRGEVQLTVHTMEAVDAQAIDPRDFLPATGRDIDQMFQRLRSLVATVADDHVRRLLEALLDDPQVADRLKAAPAAKRMHHAYLGGLLEHTLSMALLAERIAAHYTGIDRDLLICGAVVHDLGKIEELEWHTAIDYTDRGRLLSHIVIGVQMVDEKIRAIEDFPPLLADRIKHMIVSHHGAREYGAPELPKTLEAVVLHYIDEIDSRINAIRSFMGQQDPDAQWTGYHRLLERHFFMAPPSQETQR